MAAGTAALEVRDNTAAQRFEVGSGSEISYATYEISPGSIVFTHTRVPEALRGKGIATRLVQAALASARERGLAVVPRCAMFVTYMKRHPDSQDLLSAEGRRLIAL